ncbi:hypothetical protein SAMN02910455_00644 [Acidaminococcus fermentans]|uniref:ATP-binding protein n=1 Tax=Acidaminococcus fermentans TaxID=905 RepID=UPI0008F1BA45|nr:ATP-binding protein [Acidaminococcus fermentans]MCI6285285.1 ATP-binding protein [Acidaminococcus fermentans]MCI7195544.1 ATP-binding protein [Acidaminococcus fermentans]SFO48661.1 hypothetical protein SAMN02910455_00644 [Acidaminococcus fermentans]
MLQRKIEKFLQTWKQVPQHNPLVVKGCRHCGKTTSILDFAKKEYAHVVYLNFQEKPDYAAIFRDSVDVNYLVMLITALVGPEAVFEPYRTVLILDEIQECPEARSALKAFKMDGRYDVIAAGSLLGVKGYGKEPAPIAVGCETVVNMVPLDFEEFLWANGITTPVLDMLHQSLDKETPVPEALHLRLNELLRQYALVGGLPEVVETYVQTHDINAVLEKQQAILRDYEENLFVDVNKRARAKLKTVLDAVPLQLNKENKKYQYAQLKKGSKASQFEGALSWLEEAGIVTRCYNLTEPGLPLERHAIDSIFKVYMKDVGLYAAMLTGEDRLKLLQGDLSGCQGAVYESLAADLLSKGGRKLYYYHKNSGLEVDFVIRCQGKSTLVKATPSTGNTKSLKTLLQQPEKYQVEQAIQLTADNVSRKGQILELPLYFGFLVGSY